MLFLKGNGQHRSTHSMMVKPLPTRPESGRIKNNQKICLNNNMLERPISGRAIQRRIGVRAVTNRFCCWNPYSGNRF
jgi:hypothetical protein